MQGKTCLDRSLRTCGVLRGLTICTNSCGNRIPSRIAHCTLRIDSQEERLEKDLPAGRCAMCDAQWTINSVDRYSITTRSVAPRPKVSGWYISSAFVGGTTNTPGVVARATYE